MSFLTDILKTIGSVLSAMGNKHNYTSDRVTYEDGIRMRKSREEWERREREEAEAKRVAAIKAKKEREERWRFNLGLDESARQFMLKDLIDKVHPKQQCFVRVLIETFRHHESKVTSYRLDLPLKFTDGRYTLVRVGHRPKKDYVRIDDLEEIGEYQGEALNPLISHTDAAPNQPPDLPIRQMALALLYKEFKNFPFTPRQMEILYYLHHHSDLSSQNIGDALGLSLASIHTYRKKMFTRVNTYLLEKDLFPDHDLFKEKNGQKPEAKVIAHYWWQQGFCFKKKVAPV